ncbi:MAG: hypothetical protein AAFQ94_14360 [Bacteroidota bacterium]
MGTTKPEQNQNILDIALQEYGTIEMVFELMEDNNIYHITYSLSVYSDLSINREALQKDIATFYKEAGVKPATDVGEEELKLLPE